MVPFECNRTKIEDDRQSHFGVRRNKQSFSLKLINYKVNFIVCLFKSLLQTCGPYKITSNIKKTNKNIV